MTPRSLYLGVLAAVLLVTAATVGLVLHYTLPRAEARAGAVGDCQPETGDDSESVCQRRGCVWQEPSEPGAPWCTFPSGYGYRMEGEPVDNGRGYEPISLTRLPAPPMYPESPEVADLQLEVTYVTESAVRLKFVDGASSRYQVPAAAVNLSMPDAAPADTLYRVEFVREPQFGVKVVRKNGDVVVFDTSVPGLTFTDQFLSLTTRLPPASSLYGLGEHNHRQFRHDMGWKRWPIFTRDVAPVDEWNLYGAQPMYMNLEGESGRANGVFLLNSNAMDVALQPDPYPAVTFNVIGGILDFFVFLGPTPENVVQQYTELVGRPVMVPYWSLGFQLSRWDYDNLTHVRTVVDRNIAAGIPLDVQYGDIDYMESKLDFTYDRVKYDGLPEFVDELHAGGVKYIIILDHCIGSNRTSIQAALGGPYQALEDGEASDIFIRDPRNDTQYLEGEVWPGLVHYPDFTKQPEVTNWWKKQCEDFYNTDGVEYDGLWIDMNEPSNFVAGSTTSCEDNQLNFPPYIPPILGADDEESGKKNRMFDKTICMDAPQAWGTHYDTHSLYGHSMAITTYQTLREQFPTKRPMVITRSNFAGTQKYAQHWLGDNQSLWEQMPWSIVGMLEYSLFGFSYTGSDICGFWFATTEEMCQRWMQLGAFYPFARNHNGETWPDQDPANFSPEMTRVSRDILRTRYRLLPYLYTLMHEAHVHGSTVVRPLMHEFPRDKQTWSIDRQFLWGAAFMVSPAMEQGQVSVTAYVPQGRWYDYFGGLEVAETSKWHDLPTPLDKINLHVRGGHVLPTQAPANNTQYSRQQPLGLIVALDDNDQASGSLFWDDGETFETYENGEYLLVEFSCQGNAVTMTPTVLGFAGAAGLVWEHVRVWGLPYRPTGVRVNGAAVPTDQFTFDGYTKELYVFDQSLAITEQHTVTWDLSY